MITSVPAHMLSKSPVMSWLTGATVAGTSVNVQKTMAVYTMYKCLVNPVMDLLRTDVDMRSESNGIRIYIWVYGEAGSSGHMHLAERVN